ncbi:MAG: Ion-translocating oxidoreductase complex subunit C [Candidatus Celerinatantimonas neptuna]|nr:MAG: Ion-translocating oxidoreductase complex subunit C [Candidatus Celerinatantimonas neptuna]
MTLQTFNQIQNGKLWSFHGGIHPETHKKSISTGKPLKLQHQLPYILHPHQHIGEGGTIIVKVGDHVLGGQALTQSALFSAPPIHAPTSGTIEAIEMRPTAHPSARPELAIILQPDGENHQIPLQPVTECNDRMQLINAIHQAGISGMGGAGFPTAIKLASRTNIELLIINGAECEPYITADDTLMQHYAEQIRKGILWLQKILSPRLTLLAVEDDKPAAIRAMQSIAGAEFQVRPIPAKYPSGGEKQLIQILTGQQVPAGGLPADIGIIVQNVGTAYAVHRAVDIGEPLTQRIVTIAGHGIKKPRNIWVDIGTPVSALVPEKLPKHPRIIMGGAMMGYTLPSEQIPVTKTCNCILVGNEKEFGAKQYSLPCIRCGECADVCPADLLPQQLFWFIQGDELEKAENYHLKDCIECGACAYVCPSKIPLVQFYRQGKAKLREQHQLTIDAERARQRTERREQRLEREKQERELRHKQAAKSRSQEIQGTEKADTIAAAMARVKARQTGQNQPTSTEYTPAKTTRKAGVAAAVARAKAKKAQQQNTPAEADTDPRKAAVAAAVARAKAKKAQQQQDAPAEADSDPRKAAVAAAVARAKAKKAQQQNTSSEADSDPRKAAVAVAVARAKAKKAQNKQQNVSSDHNEESSDS